VIRGWGYFWRLGLRCYSLARSLCTFYRICAFDRGDVRHITATFLVSLTTVTVTAVALASVS